MTVVSNASPIITLAKLGRLELLQQLFGTVIVPVEVLNEVAPPASARLGSEIRRAKWALPRNCSSHQTYLKWRKEFGLGAGETAVILLAKELGADLALIDERLARLLAARFGIRVMGSIGILETSFRRNLVPDLRAAYKQLIANGTFIDRAILNRSLSACKLPEL